MAGGGFEPPKLSRQIYSLIPLTARESRLNFFTKAPLIASMPLFIYQHESGRRFHIPRFAVALSPHRKMQIQSGRVFSSATQPMSTIAIKSAIWPEKWSWREESNPRPADYKSAALPTELRQHLSRRSAILEKVRVISNLKCGFFLLFFKNRPNMANLMVFLIQIAVKNCKI